MSFSQTLQEGKLGDAGLAQSAGEGQRRELSSLGASVGGERSEERVHFEVPRGSADGQEVGPSRVPNERVGHGGPATAGNVVGRRQGVDSDDYKKTCYEFLRKEDPSDYKDKYDFIHAMLGEERGTEFSKVLTLIRTLGTFECPEDVPSQVKDKIDRMVQKSLIAGKKMNDIELNDEVCREFSNKNYHRVCISNQINFKVFLGEVTIAKDSYRNFNIRHLKKF